MTTSQLVEIPVYYDFASTICYVTHRVMERRAAEWSAMGIALRWLPLDLATITGWRRGADIEGERRENALRVAREFEVPVLMPARWTDSRAAHAIALRLAGSPREVAWRERVWTAVFEESRDIGDPRQIESLTSDLGIESIGIDGAEVVVAEATRAAYELGVSGVPAFDLGGWFVPGLQNDQTMTLLLQRFLQRRVSLRNS